MGRIADVGGQIRSESKNEVRSFFITRASLSGIDESTAREMRSLYGKNEMTRRRGKSVARSFLENLGDPIIRVLLFALVLNILFNIRSIDWLEVGGMAVAILLATTVSTLSERSSTAAFERLNSSVASVCRVKRRGEVVSLPVSDVCVGDIVLLSAGDAICADCLVVRGEPVLDQSALTGESREVQKLPLEISPGGSVEVTDALLSPASPHSCLRGALVSSGEGEAIVCRVGDASFLGGIVGELQSELRESPLKLRLARLARQISVFGYIAAAIIAIFSLFSSVISDRGFGWEAIFGSFCDASYIVPEILRAITLGLTVVIMAVPEGLPMMIAVVLSSNVKRMLRGGVLVRKSVGIESAGSMRLLFTDKTGTLTRGKMSVVGFILPNGREIGGVRALRSENAEIFRSFCENVSYNSSARLERGGKKAVGGNATERALLECVGRSARTDVERIVRRVPFDSRLKFSAATLDDAVYVKGAPEILISHTRACEGYDRYAVEQAIFRAQERGGRVVALCESKNAIVRGEDIGSAELKFICAAVISDPPRASSRASVEELRGAGVDVVMITGDGLPTARSVAASVGIITKRRELCIDHAQLESMSDEDVAAALPHLAVVARALPSDKSRLVRLAQSRETVVGMTGDGINDAPALRLADVGFAMGSGSDVAKDAGDIVILDDDLASIARAVLYGRTIFKSIRKFLLFQLTMNFTSALVCMIGPLVGFDTPITVTQMLWVNMIMDTLGGLAFAGEAPEKRYMREPPKRRSEPILNGYMMNRILVSGTFGTVLSIAFLKSPAITARFRESEGDLVLLSAFFAFFIFLGVVQCLNSRTDRLRLLGGITKNPTFLLIVLLICTIQISFVYLGGAALRTTPLYPEELLTTLACAALALPLEAVRKIIRRLCGHNEGF